MESISRQNGCPLNHICQKLCKRSVVGGSTTTRIATNDDNTRLLVLPTPTVVAAAQSRAATTTEGLVVGKPHSSKGEKNRGVSFEPETMTVVKSSGVHVEDKFGDYIGRVKKKLRTFSTLNSKHNSSASSTSATGGGDEFSDYIGHVKNNFARNPSTTATNYM